MRRIAGLVLVLLAGTVGAEPKVEHGTARFEPKPADNVPEAYRLQAHRFDYDLTPRADLPASGYAIADLKFPSPVTSPYAENNTVYAEYYRPHGPGPFPAVIVLEVLAGGEELARSTASLLAQNKVAALFVRMAYYGPRCPPNTKIRMLSTNIPRTMDAVKQSVLDCRRAVAWLEGRPEVAPDKLGIVGTSLGSFVAALTAEMEPKLSKVALLYGGGGFVDGYYDHPQAKPYTRLFEKFGGTRDDVRRMIAPVDPLTCAANLKGRDVLMIAAKRDDVVPPTMARALCDASGCKKIVWNDTTHIGAALFAVSSMQQLVEHFRW